MIFTIVIGLLFLAIVFFHYLQGFFSSALSAIIAVISAIVAFSMHEWIVEKFLQGKMANLAHGMTLAVLFAALYVILRTVFDKAVPGAVALPALADRIGGAIMGIVAATFSLGIVAIAGEELPFGPSIGGYTKYDSVDASAKVPAFGSGKMQEGQTFDELRSDTAGSFNETDRKNLFPIVLPGVDEWVVKTVAHLSENGSLQGSQPLSAVHPDFLQEINGQRLGIQAGAAHVTLNLPNDPDKTLEIEGVYTLSQVRLDDNEYPSVRKIPKTPLKTLRESSHAAPNAGPETPPVKIQYAGPSLDPENGKEQMLVAVRVSFGTGAKDREDNNIRLSPGSARIVGQKIGKSGNMEMCDYYPIGTVEMGSDGPVLLVAKPDDFLIVSTQDLAEGARPAIDLLYAVDQNGFMGAEHKISPGVFIEIKRMFREDLGDKELKPWSPVAKGLVLGIAHKRQPEPVAPTPPPAPTPAPETPAESKPAPATPPAP